MYMLPFPSMCVCKSMFVSRCVLHAANLLVVESKTSALYAYIQFLLNIDGI